VKRFTASLFAHAPNSSSTRERTLDRPETLLPAYELLNRIRLCASDAVLAEAEQVLHRITEQYFSPNLSVEELRTFVRSGIADADPLKSFGQACRVEIKSLHAKA
jgi:hypothetical protein